MISKPLLQRGMAERLADVPVFTEKCIKRLMRVSVLDHNNSLSTGIEVRAEYPHLLNPVRLFRRCKTSLHVSAMFASNESPRTTTISICGCDHR